MGVLLLTLLITVCVLQSIKPASLRSVFKGAVANSRLLRLRGDEDKSAIIVDDNSTLGVPTDIPKEMKAPFGTREPVLIDGGNSALVINMPKERKGAYNEGNKTTTRIYKQTSTKCKSKKKKRKYKKKKCKGKDSKKRDQGKTVSPRRTRSIRPFVKPAYATKKINFVPPAYAHKTTNKLVSRKF